MNLTFFKGSYNKTTFICSLDKFDASESQKYAARWLHKGKEMIHTLHKQSADLKNMPTEFLIEKKYSGKIVVANKRNVIWTYEKNTNFKSPRQVMHFKKIKIKNIYDYKSKKYYVDISTGRSNLVSASGSCEMNKKVSPDIQKVAESKSQDTKINLRFDDQKNIIKFGSDQGSTEVYFEIDKNTFYWRLKEKKKGSKSWYNYVKFLKAVKTNSNFGTYILDVGKRKKDNNPNWKKAKKIYVVKNSLGKEFIKINVFEFAELKNQLLKNKAFSKSYNYIFFDFSFNDEVGKQYKVRDERIGRFFMKITHEVFGNPYKELVNQLKAYDVDLIKLAEEKAIEEAKIKQKAMEIEQEKARKIAEERERKAREELELAEKKLRVEKEQQKIAEERARKEKARKLADAKAKKIAAEKARKAKEKAKKLADAKAKKIAEEKAKKEMERKLAKEKAQAFQNQMNAIKKRANNFYNDINEFVKSGADIDLLELTKLFDLKPDPKRKWNKKDLTNFENLENFMRSIIEFNAFEENKIAERKLIFEQKKDEIILSLKSNLDQLNSLLRENFSNKEFAQLIQKNIKKIKTLLSKESKNFVIEASMNLLNKSTKTIEVISNKINKLKMLDENLKLYNAKLNEVLRSNFGTHKAKKASKFIAQIKTVKSFSQKENLNNQIQIFLNKNKVAVKKTDSQKKSKTSNQETPKLTKKVKSNLKPKNTSQFPLKVFGSNNNVEVTIKKVNKTDKEYCTYMMIKNHKLNEVQLNVFGSHILKDNEGAEGKYKLGNLMSPALNPNARILKGEVHSGWSCWEIPSSNYKPETIILKPFMSSKRYVTIKLNKNYTSNQESSKTNNSIKKVEKKFSEKRIIQLLKNKVKGSLLKDANLIEKCQKELDSGKLMKALESASQMSDAGLTKNSMIVTVYSKAIELKECSFAKTILDNYEDNTGFGVKEAMKVQHQMNCS